MVQKSRKLILELQSIPSIVRFSYVILSFAAIEVSIMYFHNWGISSLLLIPGILACWMFSWKIALALEWGLLWPHIGLVVLYQGVSWYVAMVFVSGTITDLLLVGSFGALRLALDKARELTKIKDQFMTNVNHELRTPLFGVIGSIDILREHAEQLSLKECNMFLDQALYSCAELERMTSNILDAVRADSDVPPPWIQKFRLDKVVWEVLRRIDTFSHSLYIDIPQEIVVEADSQQVRQVLRNLLSNAFKYAPRDTPVAVSILLEDACASISIKDRGPGIPPEQISYLFQKFGRLECDVAGPIRGIGLGLYICKRFVENMGGRIWVKSTGVEGEGCTFSFTVPCAKEGTDQMKAQKKVRNI